MKVEIIVVDDEVRLAEQYSQKIYNETKILATFTDDPFEALSIVKENPIKIVVLDQKMPRMSGTDLFKEMIKIDPLIKGIMLTGEADANEVGDALKLGFSDYIHKSNAAKIQSRIFYYYAEYLNDLSFKHKQTEPLSLFKIQKSSFWNPHIIEFKLLSIEVLSENHVFPDSWKTIVQINAGEKKTFTDKFEITDRIVIEEEEKANLKSKIGLSAQDIVKFNSEIEATISKTFKKNIFNESKKTIEVVKEYQLQPEPQDITVNHIKSRHFQRAQVYRKIGVVIKCECNCCNMSNCVSFHIFQLTTNIATRQEDYFNDGSSRTIDTGVGYSLNG
jgi:CheY-like chemotaxis protein